MKKFETLELDKETKKLHKLLTVIIKNNKINECQIILLRELRERIKSLFVNIYLDKFLSKNFKNKDLDKLLQIYRRYDDKNVR
jgi:hypothetical protein